MIDSILTKVRRAFEQSELLRDVTVCRQSGGRGFALGLEPVRRLTDREVATLERQGNVADDWSRPLVAEGFDCRRIRESTFRGTVLLGRFVG